MKNFLVVGGAGYLGSEFCNYLLSKKKHVTCLDNFIYKNKSAIKNLKKKKNFKLINQDIRKFNGIEKIDAVIIFAGLVGDPITKKYQKLSHSINVLGVKKIINYFKNTKVKLIFISTCSNYGFLKNKLANEKTILNPKSIYAKQKVLIEKYILSLKKKSLFSPIILRFSTAFGLSIRPRFDLTINEFLLYALLKKNLQIYDHETWRPYCHVKDFSKIIYKFLYFKNQNSFEVYNVGSKQNNLRKIDIAKKIKKFLPEFKYEIVKSSSDPRNYRVNFDKISKTLNNPKFISADKGIIEMINFLKDKKNLNKFLKFGNYHISI